MSSTNPTRLSENMGPCEADCPAAILDLLSPTEHEYALDWRARCRANLAHRARKLADGDRIRLPEPVTFTDGNVAQEFVVCKRGRRLVLRDPQNGCFYRISRLMTRAWVVVPVTKIHKTLFA
ncbi:hypothetical protein BV96_04718 [Sphingomonas paucimobilis]|uniref:DUF6927 domain-containing protein n=1 Tax=Sphingobium sp. PNB TaxID=863934 RepID=UPI00044996D6|nr:hypothetical protein BV96_04718 [Sphingomonas paucimobilis]